MANAGIWDMLKNPKYANVVSHFAASCKASREQSAIVHESLETYGNHGPNVSGIARDHFPAPVKDELRRLCRVICEESDAAYAARPKWTRRDTIRHIGRLVAARDGAGFYGPQA